mmetsp:Transcript_47938/g.111843  ORF Transcript_47938/g.111843 Transcript_47938/m.111843 type:complete len:601 (-) Transcript_47938:11-1813(-)
MPGNGFQLDSVHAALSLAQQLHVNEVERLQTRSDDLLSQVQRLQSQLQEAASYPATNGHESDETSYVATNGHENMTSEKDKLRKTGAFGAVVSEHPTVQMDNGIVCANMDKPHKTVSRPSISERPEISVSATESSSHTREPKRATPKSASRSGTQKLMLDLDLDAESSTELAAAGPKPTMWKIFMMSGRFDMIIGVVIVLNAAIVGYDAVLRSEGAVAPDWLAVAEVAFLVIYLCEFGLRFWLGGWRILLNSWIMLDVFLLLCGLADIIVRGALGSSSDILENLMIIRILRLARVARVFRLVNAFKTLWVLVNGLFHSMMTLLWTFVLIFIIMYCFAIFALEVIREDENMGDEYNMIVKEHFSSLFVTCLTLLQGVTLDSVGGIYKPIIRAYPILVLYFCAFIFIVSIALMNLVTAIMVESALDQSKLDKAVRRQKQLEKKRDEVGKLRIMFHDLDTDGSGMLSGDELLSAPDEVKENLLDICEADDLTELFALLDYDDDGQVSIDEFCEGVEKVAQGKLELFNITRLAKDVLQSTGEILASLQMEKEFYTMKAQSLKPQPSGAERPEQPKVLYEMMPREATAQRVQTIPSEPGHLCCEV